MIVDQDLKHIYGWMEALQDPAFRAFFLAVWGARVELGNGCVAEIQDDGALVCISCFEVAQVFWEWAGWVRPGGAA